MCYKKSRPLFVELSVLPFWKFSMTLKISFPLLCLFYLSGTPVTHILELFNQASTFFFSLPLSHLFDCLFNSVFRRLTQLYLPTFLTFLCETYYTYNHTSTFQQVFLLFFSEPVFISSLKMSVFSVLKSCLVFFPSSTVSSSS